MKFVRERRCLLLAIFVKLFELLSKHGDDFNLTNVSSCSFSESSFNGELDDSIFSEEITKYIETK